MSYEAQIVLLSKREADDMDRKLFAVIRREAEQKFKAGGGKFAEDGRPILNSWNNRKMDRELVSLAIAIGKMQAVPKLLPDLAFTMMSIGRCLEQAGLADLIGNGEQLSANRSTGGKRSVEARRAKNEIRDKIVLDEIKKVREQDPKNPPTAIYNAVADNLADAKPPIIIDGKTVSNIAKRNREKC